MSHEGPTAEPIPTVQLSPADAAMRREAEEREDPFVRLCDAHRDFLHLIQPSVNDEFIPTLHASLTARANERAELIATRGEPRTWSLCAKQIGMIREHLIMIPRDLVDFMEQACQFDQLPVEEADQDQIELIVNFKRIIAEYLLTVQQLTTMMMKEIAQHLDDTEERNRAAEDARTAATADGAPYDEEGRLKEIQSDWRMRNDLFDELCAVMFLYGSLLDLLAQASNGETWLGFHSPSTCYFLARAFLMMIIDKYRYPLAIRWLATKCLVQLLFKSNSAVCELLLDQSNESKSLLSLAMRTVVALYSHPPKSDAGRADEIPTGCEADPRLRLQLDSGVEGTKMNSNEACGTEILSKLVCFIDGVDYCLLNYCNEVLKRADEIVPPSATIVDLQSSYLDLTPPDAITEDDLFGVFQLLLSHGNGAIQLWFHAADKNGVKNVHTMLSACMRILEHSDHTKYSLWIRCHAVAVCKQYVTDNRHEVKVTLFDECHLIDGWKDLEPNATRAPSMLHRVIRLFDRMICADHESKLINNVLSVPLIQLIELLCSWLPLHFITDPYTDTKALTSASEEQKQEDGSKETVSSSSSLADRNIVQWMMDLLELYLSNHPRTRDDGVPDPALSKDGSSISWQLHPFNILDVIGICDSLQQLHNSIPQSTLEGIERQRAWSPYAERYLNLLIRLIRQCSAPFLYELQAHGWLGIALLIPLLSFDVIHVNYVRLQDLLHAIFQLQFTFQSVEEEQEALEAEEQLCRMKQEAEEMCVAGGIQATITSVNPRYTQKMCDLRDDHSESVHLIRAYAWWIQHEFMKALQPNDDVETLEGWLPFMEQVLDASYGYLPETEESRIEAEIEAAEEGVEEEPPDALPPGESSGEEDAAGNEDHAEPLVDAVDDEAVAAVVAEVVVADDADARIEDVAQDALDAVNPPDDANASVESSLAVGEDALEPVAEEDAVVEPDEEQPAEEDAPPDADEVAPPVANDDAIAGVPPPYSSPATDRERCMVYSFFTTLFEHRTTREYDRHERVWEYAIYDSPYYHRAQHHVAQFLRCLPKVCPMPTAEPWRVGELPVLPDLVQRMLTRNTEANLEIIHSTTRMFMVTAGFENLTEYLKAYGLGTFMLAENNTAEEIQKREDYCLMLVQLIFQFWHPSQHRGDEVTPPEVPAEEYAARCAQVVHEVVTEEELAASLGNIMDKIKQSGFSNIHDHVPACNNEACIYDTIITLNTSVCSFLGALARTRGAGWELRHKRIWQKMNYLKQATHWREGMARYWSGFAEAMGSEAFDSYKELVFEDLFLSLETRPSQGGIIGQSALAIANIYMHLDIARLGAYLERSVIGIMDALKYTNDIIDAHHISVNERRSNDVLEHKVLLAWISCRDALTISLGKLLMVASSHPSISSHLPTLVSNFLDGLPLRLEVEEQKSVYSACVKIINTYPSQHIGLLEPHHSRLLQIFAGALDLNPAKHQISDQLTKFIILGAKSILKQRPELRGEIEKSNWDEDTGVSQRFFERIDAK